MFEPRRVVLSLFLVGVPVGCDGGGDDTGASEATNSTETSGDGDATTGDGDGDATVGDGDGDGDGPVSCALFDEATPQTVIAATSAGEAATAPIVPAMDSVYQVTLPEGAAGFVELQLADWETTQTIYTYADIDYTLTTEAGQEVPGPREGLAACPDAGMTSQVFFFPHWTPATLEFSATGPREIQLLVIES